MGYNLVADNTGLSSFVQPSMTPRTAKTREIPREFELIAGQYYPRSSILVSIENACDFLLVINRPSKIDCILPFSWYWRLKLENGLFSHTLFDFPLGGSQVVISGWNLPRKKLEEWGYRMVNCVILTSTVFDWSACVTNRQTDTDVW